jgi:excisionase family DNA binding protein
MNELLTTHQAAERLGVTAGRIRQLIVEGRLPAVKMGRDNFIKASDLRLVENRKVGRPTKLEAAKKADAKKPNKTRKR